MPNINLHAFSEAAAAGHPVVINTDGETANIVRAKQSAFGRVASFLSHVPFVKDLAFIKAYTQRLKTENHDALSAFIDTLSRKYGEPSTQAALHTARLNRATPLTSRVIEKLDRVARNYHGQGDAQMDDRHGVVRIWEGTEFTGLNLNTAQDNPGHASLTIKERDTNQRPIKEHISWLPAGFSLGVGPEKQIGDLVTGEREGVRSHQSYALDKSFETSDSTAAKLGAGVLARATLATNPELSIQRRAELEIAAEYFPRPNQKQVPRMISASAWQTVAQKIYFPLIGLTAKDEKKNEKNEWEKANKIVGLTTRNNNDTDAGIKKTSKFVLFGLNGQALLENARNEKSNSSKHGYTMISNHDNCASVVLRMLNAGGAGNFVSRERAWVYESVPDAQRYATQVVTTIDRLNRNARAVSDACDRFLAHGALSSSQTNNSSDQPSKREARDTAMLERVIDNNFPSGEDDIGQLTVKAKNLVETACAALESGPAHPQMIITIGQANSLIKVCEKMMQERLTEQGGPLPQSTDL